MSREKIEAWSKDDAFKLMMLSNLGILEIENQLKIKPNVLHG